MKRPSRHQAYKICRLWNAGDSSFSDIASQCAGLAVDDVAEFLASLPGYPDIVGLVGTSCRLCSKAFPKRGGAARFCSVECSREYRRRLWWQRAARKRGRPADIIPPRTRYKGGKIDHHSRRVLDEAGREAKERGVPRAAVLNEWKFVAAKE